MSARGSPGEMVNGETHEVSEGSVGFGKNAPELEDNAPIDGAYLVPDIDPINHELIKLRQLIPAVPDELLGIFEVTRSGEITHPVLKNPDRLAEQYPDIPVGMMMNKALAATRAAAADDRLPRSSDGKLYDSLAVSEVQNNLAYAYSHWPLPIVNALLRDPELEQIDGAGIKMMTKRYGLIYSVSRGSQSVTVSVFNQGSKMSAGEFDKVRDIHAPGPGTKTEQLKRRLHYGHLALTPLKK